MRAPREFRPHRVLASLAGVALLLSACAVFHFQAPDITPTAVELIDVALDRQRFKVSLHVYNPNERALPIKSAHCTLEIEGVEVGSGETSAPFNVPAHGEADFDMIVTTNFAKSVPDLLLRVARRGQLPDVSYRVSGSVNPDITLLPPIPFAKSGQFTLPSQ
jgi:LEA14-like dessication related protein